ncbi:hypothetical protein FSP39_023150 [Pinctada imbricata]|uniref:uridine/cytidine kinase n=1 Tax=Pinctada imbricata TaxID=66713 RepID=A0AA89BMW5_PINIB|nr:hypothetical protein FSP39_023150 [Pinctada imbricata]
MAAATSGSSVLNGFEREKIPRPFVIGVAGGTASGKSSVCNKIMQQLGTHVVKEQQVVIISQDSFYRELTQEENRRAVKGEFNFDHPDAFDSDLMMSTVKDLIRGKSVKIPKYNYVTNSRENDYTVVNPADVVLFEGNFVLRDTKERGRDIENILHQYTTLVKPAFEEFCLPTKKYADVIIPRGADNTVAIDLIVQHIQEILRPTKPTKRTRYNSDSYVSRPH